MNCSFKRDSPPLIIVLDEGSKSWNEFELVKDDNLEGYWTVDAQSKGYAIINGDNLDKQITAISSTSYTLLDNSLLQIGEFYYNLDRLNGNYTFGSGFSMESDTIAICSPSDKTSIETLLQQQTDRRDEIIRANEAKRLF